MRSEEEERMVQGVIRRVKGRKGGGKPTPKKTKDGCRVDPTGLGGFAHSQK